MPDKPRFYSVYANDPLYVTLVKERDALRGELDQTRALLKVWKGTAEVASAEVERLQARLCYVNPDGSHVRGCAQHEAEHPAQWCEALARPQE